MPYGELVRNPNAIMTTVQDLPICLEPCEMPAGQWPAPRYDDPAKCENPERMILEWSHGAEGGSYWRVQAELWTPGRAWLEQPPGPCDPKSEAEAAWFEWRKKEGLPMDEGKAIKPFWINGYEAKAAQSK